MTVERWTYLGYIVWTIIAATGVFLLHYNPNDLLWLQFFVAIFGTLMALSLGLLGLWGSFIRLKQQVAGDRLDLFSAYSMVAIIGVFILMGLVNQKFRTSFDISSTLLLLEFAPVLIVYIAHHHYLNYRLRQNAH